MRSILTNHKWIGPLATALVIVIVVIMFMSFYTEYKPPLRLQGGSVEVVFLDESKPRQAFPIEGIAVDADGILLTLPGGPGIKYNLSGIRSITIKPHQPTSPPPSPSNPSR